MVELHPQMIEKDGKREFVILPYEEFIRVEEALADYDDLQVLRAAKQEEGDAPTLTLSEVKAELEMT